MKFENTEIWGIKNALRGMRNPMNSWDKSDSNYCDNFSENHEYVVGQNDMRLAKKLIKAGPEHRKFMRQIFVSVDITAPLYWWKEFDQYKIGVTTNSCSTMHKLSVTPITMKCFEMDDYCSDLNYTNIISHTINDTWEEMIRILETLRLKFVETNDKRYWKELIRILPESWLQKRTVTMSYENIYNMVGQRENHKLSEWAVKFQEWVLSLPYAKKFDFEQTNF